MKRGCDIYTGAAYVQVLTVYGFLCDNVSIASPKVFNRMLKGFAAYCKGLTMVWVSTQKLLKMGFTNTEISI